jgi:hypothetical protein
VTLVIEYVIRTRLTILSSVNSPTVPYLSTRSPKRHDFRKRVIVHNKCILILSTFFILRLIQRDVINVCWSSCTVPVILVSY